MPLKMNCTSTTWKPITSDNNACKTHTPVANKLIVIPTVNVDIHDPAASINSSVKDLASWLLMQLDSGRFEGKQVVPFEALQLTRSSNTIVADLNPALGSNLQVYGLGWFMLNYHEARIIRHNGGANGFVTTTCFIPSMQLGIVVLSSTDANSFYSALGTQIIDAYMGLPYINQSERIFTGFSADIQLENSEINGMKETASKNPKALLLKPPGENDFLCTYSDPLYGIKKIFFTVKDGKVKSITLKVDDFVDYMEYEFTKE